MCKVFARKLLYLHKIRLKISIKRDFLAKMSRFKTVVSSKFDELWRYNIVVVCELCDKEGNRLEYNAEKSNIAPVGSNLTAKPEGYAEDRTLRMESGKGDHINLLVYVIPHTLPATNDIHATKPFPLIIKVEADGEVVMNQVFNINQWSGENIAVKKLGAKE